MAKNEELFFEYSVANWEDVFNAITYGHKVAELTPNTS